MGIPSYFAFLVNKYPNIIKKTMDSNISRLYLDLNCAIHPCCQKIIKEYGNSLEKDLIEKKMLKEITNYIEFIFCYINPSELLFISIDGPAPRAKMSQQRQRRYKSINEKKYEKKIMENNGNIYKELWDTNAITPGTIFMQKISQEIIKYIESNQLYKNINVIFSDSNTCGEGEHKILDHIKTSFKDDQEGVDIIYGLDADLIMLSLVIL